MGSMWMSEARSPMAWLISRFTILTIGPSSTADGQPLRVELVVLGGGRPPRHDSSRTDSSRWLYLRIAASMSAAVATTGWTSIPVIVRMSSRANRLAGSAMATTSRPSS